MAIEGPADLAVFFDTRYFGTEGYYTPVGGVRTAVNGIFQDPQASRALTENMEVSIPECTFQCRTSDIGDDAEGDALEVNGVAYTIKAIVTDGTGVTTCMLEED